MDLLLLAFLGVLFMVAGTFYMKKIMFMIIDGEITSVQSLYYLGSFLVTVILFFTLNNIVRVILLLLLFGFLFAFEPIRNYLGKEENRSFYMRKIMKCDEALLLNPNDWGLLSMKAECYFKIKDYDKAVEIQTKAVSLSQNDLAESEKLKKYRKYLDSEESTDVKCWFCGRMTSRGVDTCGYCGHSLNFGINLAGWLRRGGYKEIIINTAGLLLIIFLYKFLLSFLSENLRFFVHIITAVVIGGCIAYKIFKKDK